MTTPSPVLVPVLSTTSMLPYGPHARVASVGLVFGKSNAGGVVVGLGMLPPGQQFGHLASLKIDNSQNPLALQVVFPDTGATIDVCAYTSGTYPAITGAQQFRVSVPLLGYVTVEEPAFLVPVTIQALNVPLQPGETVQPPAAALAGAAQQVGQAGAWSSYTSTIAGGAGLLFTALQLTNNTASQISVAGVDIFGNPWEVQQGQNSSEELKIPPTLPGESLTVTVVGGGTINGPLNIVWRPVPFDTGNGVQPIAGSVTVNAGTVAASTTITAALPAGGNTIGNVGLTGALPSGNNLIGQVLTAETGRAGANPNATIVANAGTAAAVFGLGQINNGAWIRNPYTAQNPLFVDFTNTAGTVEVGTTFALQPGDTVNLGRVAGPVTVNAIDAGHTFSAVRF